jgi:hypothetical protein
LLFREKGGDSLLRRYKERSPEAVHRVDRDLAEGATLDDIRKWANRSQREREFVIRQVDLVRATMFLVAKEKMFGEDEALAADYANRRVPLYGIPDGEPPNALNVGEDRPLPGCLHHRVESWSIRNGLKPGARKRYKELLEGYETINSLIRAEIRAGRL